MKVNKGLMQRKHRKELRATTSLYKKPPLHVVISNLVPDGKYILKVQTSLNGTGECLMCDEPQEVMVQVPICKVIKKAMGGEPKKFFHVDIKAGFIIIDKEAKWQTW